MAISLDLYSSDQQTQYTDTDQDGSVDLYLMPHSVQTMCLGWGSIAHNIYNWVTSTGQSDSNGNPLYTMSTSPVTGVTDTQFLYAVPNGGGSSFYEASKDSLWR